MIYEVFTLCSTIVGSQLGVELLGLQLFCSLYFCWMIPCGGNFEIFWEQLLGAVLLALEIFWGNFSTKYTMIATLAQMCRLFCWCFCDMNMFWSHWILRSVIVRWQISFPMFDLYLLDRLQVIWFRGRNLTLLLDIIYRTWTTWGPNYVILYHSVSDQVISNISYKCSWKFLNFETTWILGKWCEKVFSRNLVDMEFLSVIDFMFK